MMEVKAVKINEMKNNEMRTISAGGGKEFLLCLIDNKYYALSARCPHNGALLSEGILNGDRLICSMHHSCFNAKTGCLIEPPAQDVLHTFDVTVNGDDVIVTIPESFAENVPPKMFKTDLRKDGRLFVIIGGGVAGNAAAQTLREDGFAGKIMLVTQEDRNPYLRRSLSKEYIAGEIKESAMSLRSRDFYKEYDIEIILNTKVSSLDTSKNEIVFAGGESIRYDKVLIASGGKAKKLNLPGEHLKNVFYLRSFNDAERIIKASKTAGNVVIIGASFIGLETAYGLSKRNKPVTIISQELIPFERVFGREVGKLFKTLHEKNGVTFRLSRTLKSFEGDEKVEAVALQQGSRIDADLVILGVGVEPATDFIKDLKLCSDGSIKVNRYFQAAKDVYAAGDIVTIRDWRTKENIRIEHWRSAHQQGRIAAHNMAGIETSYNCVPFFWTSQVGLDLMYVGNAPDWQEIVIHGDIMSKDFMAFYIRYDQVYAAAGSNRNREMAAIEELMRLKKMPSVSALKYDSVDFLELLSK